MGILLGSSQHLVAGLSEESSTQAGSCPLLQPVLRVPGFEAEEAATSSQQVVPLGKASDLWERRTLQEVVLELAEVEELWASPLLAVLRVFAFLGLPVPA